MYKILLMTICVGNVTPSNNDIYINDAPIRISYAGKDNENLGICPTPLTEEEIQSRITDDKRVFPVWQMTDVDNSLLRVIRVPYYSSGGAVEADEIQWKIISKPINDTQ